MANEDLMRFYVLCNGEDLLAYVRIATKWLKKQHDWLLAGDATAATYNYVRPTYYRISTLGDLGSHVLSALEEGSTSVYVLPDEEEPFPGALKVDDYDATLTIFRSGLVIEVEEDEDFNTHNVWFSDLWP